MSTGFTIKYDFNKERENPQDIFKSLSLYIEAYNDYTKLLMEAMGLDVESKLILTEVERGSIKNILKRVLGVFEGVVNVENSAQKTFDCWTDKDDIGSRKRISRIASEVEDQLQEDNPEMKMKPKIDEEKLAYALEKFKAANDLTLPGENVFLYENDSPEKSVIINSGWKFSVPAKKLFEKESVYKESDLHLTPIIAAFKGQQAWKVHISEMNESVNIKILDQVWLERYQKGFEKLRPGYTIHAKVGYDAIMIELGFGKQKPEKLDNFKLIKVIDVFPGDNHQYDLGERG